MYSEAQLAKLHVIISPGECHNPPISERQLGTHGEDSATESKVYQWVVKQFKEESKCVSWQKLLQCSLDTELSWQKVKRQIFSYPRVYSGGHILWDVTRHDHNAKT